MRKVFKSIIMDAGYYTGVFEFFRRRYSRQGNVPILVYHRLVNDPVLSRVSSSFRLRGLTVSVNNFEEQIKYLKRKYRLVNLTEYARRRKTGESLANCAVITFDDGYKDLLTLGWPIIRKYEVPVTVFFPKGFLTAVHWQHQLYYVLDEAAGKKASVAIGKETVPLDLSQDLRKYQSIIGLLGAIRKLPAAERVAAVGAVSKTLGVIKQLAPGEFYLSAEDLKLLASAGAGLGAHTVSHSDMLELSEQQIDQEIAESVAFIRDLTGQHEVPFALPFSAGDGKVLDKIKINGCLCSFGRAAGLNDASQDIFQLRRIAVLDFNIAEFAYNVSGAGMK